MQYLFSKTIETEEQANNENHNKATKFGALLTELPPSILARKRSAIRANQTTHAKITSVCTQPIIIFLKGKAHRNWSNFDQL
jgi:hypothetical protein